MTTALYVAGGWLALSAATAGAHRPHPPHPHLETPPMTEHRPLTLLVGPGECHERECGEYDTPDGYDDPGIERCSHITEEIVCAACSTEHDTNGLYGGTVYDPTVPWPCTHAARRGEETLP